jgi:acetylornithine deacetylase
LDSVTRLLADLVAIPSVNPMGRALAGSGFHEAGMTAYLERWFQELGVLVERQPIAPGRENLIATFRPEGARKTLLFDAHQDTVPTDGMTIEPFAATIRDGKLYGRGACDIKGGMASMLTAFARLVRERPGRSAAVIMVCTVDEEYTHLGSSRLAQSQKGVDLAVVAEPTMLQVVNCHKGAVRWKVATSGVACHSSTPELGRNAIYKMAEVVFALKDYANAIGRQAPHAMLGAPSLSVGRIEGGQSVNVVPDWCEVDVDRRLVPGETGKGVIAGVRSFLESRLGGLEDVKFLPAWVDMPVLAPENTEGTGWVEVVQRAVGRVMGFEPGVRGVPYGTDAGPLGEAGYPQPGDRPW